MSNYRPLLSMRWIPSFLNLNAGVSGPLLFLIAALTFPGWVAAQPALLSPGESQRVILLYDADGNRVGKTVVWRDAATGSEHTREERFLVDDLNPTGFAQVVGVVRREGSGRAAVAERALFGLGPVGVATTDSSNAGRAPETKSIHFVTDGHGSLRRTTDEAALAGDPDHFTAWGQPLASTNKAPARWRYGGEEWDSDLGMYWLRARHYDPGLGRFSTMDSFEGVSLEPATLHKFVFCHNDPGNRIDPSGHESLVSINLTMTVMSQMATHELRAAGATLKGIRAIYGADDDINSLIYGIDIATIIDEKVGQVSLGVAAVLGGVKLVRLAANYLADQAPLRFAQATAHWQFSPKGTFKGMTIGELSDSLRQGTLSAAEVPVEYVVRTVAGRKVRLIVNTRSSLALQRAQIPQSRWNLIDKTADTELQNRMTARLRDNGLPEDGTDVLRIGTRNGPEEYSVLE